MSVAAVNERLAALSAAGTSVWLDQLGRGMLASGELQRLVEEACVRGVTGNTASLERAILGSPDYDEELAALAREGRSAREVYRELAIHDVQRAADLLRPLHERSEGEDGWVSLDVAPWLAHDTAELLEQLREDWARVDRPNFMVQVPATPEGIAAVEQALLDGMHVKVSPLFAVAAYEQVMEAYLRAMERRLAAGLPLDRRSVAAFFVSRVDTEVDARLEAAARPDLRGRAGLANARAAYAAFRRVFGGERFAPLRAAGCPVQRLLWASTGVKGLGYPETRYVYGLVGPDTVCTMPLPTLMAAAHEGGVTGATALEDPTPDLDALRAAGIDLEEVTETLLRDGIEGFLVPMSKLLDGIEVKREAIVTGRPTSIGADLPPALEEPVAERVRRAAEEEVARRIWERDGTLWAPAGTPEVTDRLGWLTIAEKLREAVPELERFVADVQADGLTDAVLLGMGGSSLAPEVFRRSQPSRALRLHVLDTTEPLTIAALADALDLASTLFIVSSKSGGTIETRSHFEHFHARQPDGAHFVAVTDPGTALAQLGEEHGFRRVFLNDPEIGGRYSALSYVGLVPAALMGVDLERVLDGAAVAEQACRDFAQPEANSGLWLGNVLGELARHGRDKLSFVVDEPISAFGLWAEQLVAESTGKQGRGILPIADEPVGAPGAYGPDRVFVHLRNATEPDPRHGEALAALAAAGHPTITLQAHGPADLGRIFFFSEFATAVAGWALEINPFDQPDVQEAKDTTQKALGGGVSGLAEASEDALRALMAGLEPPRYLAIMGYLPYAEELDAAVGRLRALVRDRRRVATTYGYGPRFLHSTGQLHKGGPETGVFLQLVHDSTDDLEIPGREFGFRTLIGAQADGDLATLRDHGLPAERVRLRAADLAGSLEVLTATLEGML